MVSKDVVEVSYQGLQVDCNERLTCSGLKLSGSTDQEYAYYLDHNLFRKKQIRSRARPLFECVLRQIHAQATPQATNQGRHTGTANREKLRRREQSWRHERSREGSTLNGKRCSRPGASEGLPRRAQDAPRYRWTTTKTSSALSVGGWKVLEGEQAMESHDRGIVAATDSRVVLLEQRPAQQERGTNPLPGLSGKCGEQGPGNLTVVAPRYDYSLTLDQGAAGLADFIRGRLPSDAASMEDRLSSILMGGERIDHWAHWGRRWARNG